MMYQPGFTVYNAECESSRRVASFTSQPFGKWPATALQALLQLVMQDNLTALPDCTLGTLHEGLRRLQHPTPESVLQCSDWWL